MKKKGFTLIELLAVIVVLAIIALIATPIVMSTIKRVQKSAAERSAESYIGAVETVVATERLDGNILEGEYEITSDGNICRDKSASCSDKDKIIIDMKGTKPKSGKITISNGNAEISEKITVGTFDVVYNPTTKSYEAKEKGSSSSEDDKPTVETLCKAVTVATTGNVPSGSFNYGDEYICNLGDTDDSKNLIFFVLDKTDTEVSLIMNKNLGGTVTWCKSGSNNSCAADNLIENLNSYTSNWTKLTSLNGKITLPTADQLTSASGKIFDDEGGASGLSSWLYDYLEGTTHSVSGFYGYWTSTPDAYSSRQAWYVRNNGGISYEYVDYDLTSYFGIRPVITISKSQLS